MAIFKDKETAAALELVSASLTESESKVAELEAKVSSHTDLTAELETAKKAIAEFEAHGIEASSKLEAVNAELVTFKEAQADFDDKVANKVRAELSAKGTHPAPDALSDEEKLAGIKAEYDKLPAGQARSDFRKANMKYFR